MATVAAVRCRRGRALRAACCSASRALHRRGRARARRLHADDARRSRRWSWFTAWRWRSCCGALHTVLRLRRWARGADPVIIPAVVGAHGPRARDDSPHRLRVGGPRRDNALRPDADDVGAGRRGLCVAMIVWACSRTTALLRRYHLHGGRAWGSSLCSSRSCPSSGATINGAQIWVVDLRPLAPARRVRQDRVRHLLRRLPGDEPRHPRARRPQDPGHPLPARSRPGSDRRVWAMALVVQIYQRDLGASLLFFGIFVACSTSRPNGTSG